jgi:hypothetical protein
MEAPVAHTVLGESKRSIVTGILQQGSIAPAPCQIQNIPRHLRRLLGHLRRERRGATDDKAGPSGYDLYVQLMAVGVAGDGWDGT